ncbi:uncharacterized protein LOC126892470 [Diabrotica virgifera virgifera]|uniref:DUF4806 domain-containing protein n=1 Tax=Diabrotica virgifera virgifera TaxID=50390 RepID=A0ABM5L694_DIAVI|nr:uncharacterized protein LOC126892470 [Diabrotica virgifera virgifera]
MQDQNAVRNNKTMGSNHTILEQCKNCVEKDKQLKILIQQGHIQRGLVTETLNEVKKLKEMILNGVTESKNERTSFFQNENLDFPIKTDIEFEKFEEYLQDEDNFSKALQEISKLGGRNAYDFIKRAFQLILSNDQALKYSWKGMKGNRKFNDTRLATLLLRATDVTRLADSQKTSECAIQTWLRRASDRKATVLNKTF